MKHIKAKNKGNVPQIETPFNAGEKVSMFLATCVILILNSGTFNFFYAYVPSAVMYGFFFLWLLISFSHRKLAKFDIQQLALLAVFWIMVLISTGLVSSENNLFYLYCFTYLIMLYLILITYRGARYSKFRKFLVIIITLDYLFVALNTFIQLTTNPLLSRILSTNADYMAEKLGEVKFYAVGAFSYFYSLVPIMLLLAFLLFSKTKKKIVLLGLLVFAFALLIKASFALSVLLAAIFILIMIIRTKFTHYKIILLLFVILPLLLLTYLGSIPAFFGFLSRQDFISQTLSIRFAELADLFANNGSTNSDVNIRITLYQVSIDTFLRSPIWGNFGFISKSYDIIGAHSGWFDLIAAYGSLSLVIITFFIREFRYNLSCASKKVKIFVETYWLYFVVLGILNPIFGASFFVMWMIYLPFVTLLLTEKENDMIEE
jgi:hypothetical protein